MKWIAVIVALGCALTAGPAVAGVGLLAQKGEPLRRVELPEYRGLLTSTSTRIPGLIAADDLEHRERLGSLRVSNARARVARLERRLEQLHGARRGAYVLLAVLTVASILLALWRQTDFWRRICIAIAPSMLAVSLVLGIAGAARSALILPFLGFGSIALAGAMALPRRAIAYIGPAILLLFFVVLWAWPETAGFSAIGPRPEVGGRFYGVNNLVETVLLTMSLFSAAELGLAAVLPMAALALVTVGWSRTGADGGGLIVFAAAFAFLGLRLAGRITLRRVALALVAGVAVVLAFVAIDEASGGHSHVTRAFEQGPAGWFGDIGHRLHLSADQLATVHVAVIVGVSLLALVWLAFQRPRSSALDALLLGLAVSLVINDAPSDVAAGGAISGFVLFAWATTRYTRARALADPDSGLGSTPGRGLWRPGHWPRAAGYRRRDDRDTTRGQG